METDFMITLLGLYVQLYIFKRATMTDVMSMKIVQRLCSCMECQQN
jgi:hypothetical protein